MNASIQQALVLGIALSLGLTSALVATEPSPVDEQTPAPVLLAQADEKKADDPVPAPPPDRGPTWRERGGFGDRDVFTPLSQEQREQLLAVLEDLNPQMKQRLQEVLKDNPQRANMILRRAYDQHIQRLIQLRESDPEHYELQISEHKGRLEMFRLVRQIRDARESQDEAKATELTAQLREKMDTAFEVRQKLRRKELAELEKRIEKMRTDLAEHEQRKGELIDQAMEKVLSGNRLDEPEGDGPGRGDPMGPPAVDRD